MTKTTFIKIFVTGAVMSLAILPLSIALESDWLLKISAAGIAASFFILVVLSLIGIWVKDV